MAAWVSPMRPRTAGSICSSRMASKGMGKLRSRSGFCIGTLQFSTTQPPGNLRRSTPRAFAESRPAHCGQSTPQRVGWPGDELCSKHACARLVASRENSLMTESAKEGDLLWEPSEAIRGQSRMSDYLAYLERTRALKFESYAELYAWSVS